MNAGPVHFCRTDQSFGLGCGYVWQIHVYMYMYYDRCIYMYM